MTRPAQRPARRIANALPWIAAIAGAVLLGGVVAHLVQTLRGEVAEAETRARILASGIAEAVSRRIEGIDFALAGLAARIDPRLLGDPAHLRAVDAALLATRGLSRDTNTFIVIDRDGRLVATSRVPPEQAVAADLSGSPVFALAAADPGTGLYLSRPYPALLGAQQHRTILTLGRALFDPAGGFAGVVAAVLPGQGPRALLPDMPLTDRVVVRLIRHDGVPLEQRPPAAGLPDGTGPIVPPSALFGTDGNARSGSSVAVSDEAGQVFIAAWHSVDGGRAAVLTAISRANVIADWAELAAPLALASALLAAALVLLAVRLAGTIARLDSALGDLAASEGEIRTIADALGIVLWLRPHRLGVTRYRGAAAERMTGRPLAELESRPFFWREEVTHPDDRDALRESYRGVDLAHGWRHVYRILAADGTLRWIEDRAVQPEGADRDGPVYGTITDITELRIARERLSRQDRQIADAVRLSGLCFWRRAEGSELFEWGEESYRQFGVDPASFVPSRAALMAMIEPDDRPVVQAAIARLRATGESESYAYRIRRPDGSVRVRWSLASAERDENDCLVAFVGVSQDITEQRLASERIARQEHQIAEAGRVARIGFYRRDLSDGTINCTAEFLAQHGLDPDARPDIAMLRGLVHPDDLAALEAMAQEVIETGETRTLTYRIIRPDGMTTWLRATVGLERGPGHAAVAVSGLFQDVTDEVAAREQLDRQRRFLDAARRIGHVGLYWRALDSDTYTWTDEIYAGYGVDPREFVPTRAAVRALAHPEDLPLIDAAARRLIEIGESGTVTYRIIRRDGTMRWRRATAGIERGPDGRPIGLVGVSQDVTEEVEARAQLERQQRFLDAARRVGRIGFFRHPLDGGPYTWTEEIYRDFGVDPATFTPSHRTLMAMIHPDDRAQVEGSIQRAVEEGESGSRTYRIVRPDGHIRWRRVATGLERRADGAPVAMVGVAQDVTEEVEAAEQIHQRDTMLADAGRIARVGFWRRRLDEDAITWSDEVYRHFGLDPGGAVPTAALIHERLHPDDIATWEGLRQRLRETGEPQTITVRVRDAEGGYRWIRNSAGLERGSDGVIAIFGTTQDLTAEIEAREQLIRQQRQLADAGRVAGLGFWRLKLGSSTLELSDAIYDQIGIGPRGVTASAGAILALMPEEDRDAVRAVLDRVAATGEQASITYRIRRPDGTMRHRNSTMGLERAPDGTPVAVVGISTDVTDRVEQEARLERAQRLNALGELTGGIAHDVNNLLSVIGLNLELLREQVPGSEAQDLTDAALHAVGQGAKLARGLLAFAQRQSLKPTAVPLGPLVAGLEALLRRTLGGRTLLGTEVAGDTPPALVDPALLETALVNLVLNARDAMPKGGTVTIRAARAGAEEAASVGLAATPHVRVSVADEGEGMAPEIAARAFEPFFTTKGAGKGTGLGLAMVYGFARQSGGEIRIDSAPGAGTTVTLWLPEAPAEAAGAAEPPPTDHAALAGARVLVAEDEAPLRELVGRICRDARMEVRSVADGASAIALLRYGVPVDLLLTDIRMPGQLDGHALAAEARALRPGLPVVLMTGYDDTGLDDGGLPLLRKPFGRGPLLDALAAARRDAAVAAVRRRASPSD